MHVSQMLTVVLLTHIYDYLFLPLVGQTGLDGPDFSEYQVGDVYIVLVVEVDHQNVSAEIVVCTCKCND